MNMKDVDEEDEDVFLVPSDGEESIKDESSEEEIKDDEDPVHKFLFWFSFLLEQWYMWSM